MNFYKVVFFFLITAIFLGDSILRRVNELLHVKSFRSGNKKICNELCVGGQTVKQLVRRIKSSQNERSLWYQNFFGKNIILMIGTNNVLQNTISRVQFARPLKWLVSECLKLSPAALIICTLPPILKNKNLNDATISINETIKMVATEKNIHVVNIREHFPDDRALFER